jgi:hypothetical protein
VVVTGYGDSLEWRSFRWAVREMAEYYLQLGWTRSPQDLFNLWFRREAYVEKYYPEMLNG